MILCLGTRQASSQDTKSLTRARFLLFPSTRDGTSISRVSNVHDVRTIDQIDYNGQSCRVVDLEQTEYHGYVNTQNEYLGPHFSSEDSQGTNANTNSNFHHVNPEVQLCTTIVLLSIMDFHDDCFYQDNTACSSGQNYDTFHSCYAPMDGNGHFTNGCIKN